MSVMQARENRTARATILRHLSRNYNVLFARESPPLSILRSYLADEKMATEQAVYYRPSSLYLPKQLYLQSSCLERRTWKHKQ